MNLKKKAEALLFSSGRKMAVEELTKLLRCGEDELDLSLKELSLEYEDKDSSLMVLKEGHTWKITVREEHLPLVQKIITQTELSKSLMETLAVIAFKYPIKQAELIKIRTNKAYDHLKELEEIGYITRQKFGRTKLIKLTQKFFDYFSLPEEGLKEHFQDFKQIADAITDKEKEVETIKQEQQKLAEEARTEKEAREKAGGVDIEDLDEESIEKTESTQDLEIYDKKNPKPKIEKYNDKLGKLDVVDSLPQTTEEESEEDQEQPPEQEVASESEEEDPQPDQEPSEEEIDDPVSKRVAEIMKPINDSINKNDNSNNKD